MIRILVNGLAASAGGGLTYLINLVPQLARRQDVEATILVSASMGQLVSGAANVSIVEEASQGGTGRRFLHEQRILPAFIRQTNSQVLISAGNFALRKSPVAQILLSRNALYTSADFREDLQRRGELRLLLETRIKAWLARRSIGWADRTVAPSRAFADELQNWTGARIDCIHHGFDAAAFARDTTPLSSDVQAALGNRDATVRLLFVSHYNYYRNFETLFRALPLLRDRLQGRQFRLYLTCKMNSADNPGSYRAENAGNLIERLGIAREVVQLGAIPYRALHHLYRACDIYVTPAYAESFAHPLVEAMSCGLPIIASDLQVHREICGEAARYFPRFEHDALAGCIAQVAGSPQISKQLSSRGLNRAKDFSWERHVEELLALAARVLAARTGDRLRAS